MASAHFEIDLSASTAPIPELPDVSMETNASSDAIPFRFGDLGATPAASLQVTAISSDPTLIPNANLILSGTWNSRSLIIVPAADQFGIATVTVSLTDGKWTSSRSFKLTVTDSGTVTAIASGAIHQHAAMITDVVDLTTDEDTAPPPLAITIGDAENSSTSFTLSGTSSNHLLVTNANVAFSGTAANRSVAISPLSNANGSAVITLSVYDGRVSTSKSFELTVISVDDAPTITSLEDQALTMNSNTGAIKFAVADFDDPVSSLEVNVSSSHPGLVPLDAILLGGSVGNHTIAITPVQGVSGSSTLIITASDGNLAAVESFVVTVNGFAFLFDHDTNFEGWIHNAAVTGPVVSGGALSATLAGTDPQFNRAGLNFSANHVPLVLVRLKSSAGGIGQLFWGNEDGGASAARSITFNVPAGSIFKWYALDVATNTNWTDHAIKSLRLDPSDVSGTVSIAAMISSDGDFENDSMDDRWEIANQLDPSSDSDAAQDSDGDGIPNAFEYILGSNPIIPDPTSPLALSRSGAGFTLTFAANQTAGAGYTGLSRYYDVETTADLTDSASWVGISGYTDIVGAGQTVMITLPISSGARFCRLKVRVSC